MDDVKSRLKRILQSDKSVPSRMEQVLRAEIFGVLQSYLDVKQDDVFLELDINESGVYEIKLCARANSVKTFYQV